MKEDFEFGDGSPAEMAWRRSSEYPFIEFILMMLTKPFKVFHTYKDQVAQGITIYNSREGFNTNSIIAEKEDVKLASINGIGACSKLEMGYIVLSKKEYAFKSFG